MKKEGKTSNPSLTVEKPRHLAPVTPILDEQAIIGTLSVGVNPESANEYLRTASMLSIVDAYDRKIDRGAFTQITNRAASLVGHLRELEILCRLRIDLRNGTHPREVLLQVVEDLVKRKMEIAEDFRIGLHRDMKLVSECAWEKDPIN